MLSTSSLTTTAAEETAAAGRRLGEAAVPGDILLLSGPLGAGKTVLVQGMAAGLGSEAEVASPSFVLVRIYPGRLELVHADLYRLDTQAEVDALALLELSARGVLAVEWADRAVWPVAEAAHVSFGPGDGEDSRRLDLEGGPQRFHDALLAGGSAK